MEGVRCVLLDIGMCARVLCTNLPLHDHGLGSRVRSKSALAIFPPRLVAFGAPAGLALDLFCAAESLAFLT